MATVELTEAEKFQQEADRHGKSCVEDMRDDLAALEHAQTCKRKGCKRGSETKAVKLKNGETVQQMKHQNPEAWHSLRRALQVIREGHYGIQVRTGWYSPGNNFPVPEEYVVILSGGGPASRIHGDLGDDGQPLTAHFEFQDWGTPWTEARLTCEDEDILLDWVQYLKF